MITPPSTAEPPQPGPLAAPSEDELVAAYRELRDHALTLPWAAVALGLEPARLEALARAGELLVVPGPWPMRQAHASGLGYFLPPGSSQPAGRFRIRPCPRCSRRPSSAAGRASICTAS